MSERVLVVSAELITFQGMNQNYRRVDSLIHDHGKFMDRDAAEKCWAYKQVIPYVVMTCGDRIMSYVRGKAGGEARLHDLRSIGIGGHVNPFMKNEDSPLTAFTLSTDREVEEEVMITTIQHRGHAIALLNDDSTPVGRVHLGVVFHWQLREPKVEAREVGKITDIQWDPARVLLQMELEPWSRIVLEGCALQEC
jgi:predicted NUDIX family phosphoesterase